MFESLRRDILACRFLPGSKLRISDLAETSEVSLGAVREALSRLSAEGLVVAESQKGYRVDRPGVGGVERLALGLRGDPREAAPGGDEVGLPVEIALRDRTRERDALDFDTRLGEVAELVGRDRRANGAFHEMLVAACGSAKLLQIRWQLYQQTERHRRYSGVIARKRDVGAEHRRIFDAAIARDRAKATAAIAVHLRLTADVIVAALTREEGSEATQKRV